MTEKLTDARRTIVLAADDKSFPVVFEMGGTTIQVPAYGQVRVEVLGPESARLTIGHGDNGVSVFCDSDLVVEVFDQDGTKIDDLLGF